ncbi:Nucleotidylyl transferase [Venustampulla echinocandica]|uniref:glutamate--tRNA ligase n=1 Tax=Venustampulla echinocandica TaxID=2656787 RepID=A0A370TGJ7_9HELO|nr:Nucleotidylyl transferase [Venustampulla echinocandica]RDL34313.1 Nucleotidylyl transferase [Venustampulla echinocandica]
MAPLEIATKTNPVLVLPSLVITDHLERTKLPLSIVKTFHEGLALAHKASVKLTLDDGKNLKNHEVVQYFAELSNSTLNASPQYISSIQEWIKRSESFALTDFQSLRKPLDELNSHLTLRTHIVGYSLTIVDLAVWATLRGNKIIYGSFKRTKNNVSRWFQYIEASNPWISELVTEFMTHTTMERAALSAAGASYEIDLPNIEGPMVTRFPPEPSGWLHIGHAKALLLNDYFAHKHPGGTLICRFDDTNPSKENMEFQDSILQDLKSMDITAENTTYSSDYFQVMYDYALKLINDGKAFADDSELGNGDEDRKNRLPSKRRDLSIEETLEHFAEMKTGSEEGRRWCIRARIAYDSPNGTLRDPVIYRCNLIPHHRTGTEWKIYPIYDFCAPILDAVEGVTVALRTNEYRDRNAQYEWMQDALGLRKVTIWDFSRINFIRTVLSKRKLTKIVDEGKVWGWDDPRMPTIRGILRRGMTENAVYCTVRGIDGPDTVTKPKYVKNLELGSKKVMYDKTIVLEQFDAQSFEKDEEITLMNWGNAYARSITRDPPGKVVTGIELELHFSGDFKKTKKVSWLAADSKNMVPVDLVSFDYLITKDKLEEDDTLEDFLTKDTEFRSQAFADCNVAELPHGAIIQFERKGYYKLDVAYKGDKSRIVFFDIPTGRA